jgi:hypothetical protein
MQQTLDRIDDLVINRMVPMRERIVAALREKHPQILKVVEAVLAGQDNKVGMQVLEGGRVAGEYTFSLDGIRIKRTEAGRLDSGIHHPFLGLVKPYFIIESSTIEKFLGDEASIVADPFATAGKYFPDITIKFLK